MDPVKFTFDKSFDAGAGNRHEEEMNALRSQASADIEAANKSGFDAGHAQALTEIESATVAVLEQIQGSATGLFNEFHAIRHQISVESAQIAHMVGLQLAETHLTNTPTSEIEAVVKSVFEDLYDVPRLVIRLNADVADVVEPRIREMEKSANLNGELVIAADPALNPQDIYVEWEQGGIKREFEVIQQTIQDRVMNYVNGIIGEEGQPAEETEQA